MLRLVPPYPSELNDINNCQGHVGPTQPRVGDPKTNTVMSASAAVTTVPNTGVSVSMTTSTSTAYATAYAFATDFPCADPVGNAAKERRSEPEGDAADSALDRRAPPPGVFRGYSPRQISSACSCLSIRPSTTTILTTSTSTSFSTTTTGSPSVSVTTVSTSTTSTVTLMNATPTFDVYSRGSDGYYSGTLVYQSLYTFRTARIAPHFYTNLQCDLVDHDAGDVGVFGGPGTYIGPFANAPIGYSPVKCRIAPTPYADTAEHAYQSPDYVYFPMTCTLNGNQMYSSSYDCANADYWALSGTTAPSGCQTDPLQMLAVFPKSSFTRVTS